MTLYVLDTDILSLAMRADSRVMARIMEHDTDQLAITVITVEEQIRGWYDQLRRAKDDETLARAYRRLGETIEAVTDLRVLPFEVTTIQRFRRLEQLKLGVRTMDLRIAATVIAHGGILVTRNRGDFEHVPGLVIEDWSR